MVLVVVSYVFHRILCRSTSALFSDTLYGHVHNHTHTIAVVFFIVCVCVCVYTHHTSITMPPKAAGKRKTPEATLPEVIDLVTVNDALSGSSSSISSFHFAVPPFSASVAAVATDATATAENVSFSNLTTVNSSVKNGSDILSTSLPTKVDAFLATHPGFVNNESTALFEALTCPHCLCLFDEPRTHRPCKNTFCRNCLEHLVPDASGVRHCSMCKHEVTSDNVDDAPNVVRHLMDSIQLTCLRCQATCNSSHTLQHKTTSCRYPCIYNCDEGAKDIRKYNHAEWLVHLENGCPTEPIPCSAEHVGCSWMGVTSTKLEHFNNCPYIALQSHLKSQLDIVTDLKKQIALLQQQLQATQSSGMSFKRSRPGSLSGIRAPTGEDMRFLSVVPSDEKARRLATSPSLWRKLDTAPVLVYEFQFAKAESAIFSSDWSMRSPNLSYNGMQVRLLLKNNVADKRLFVGLGIVSSDVPCPDKATVYTSIAVFHRVHHYESEMSDVKCNCVSGFVQKFTGSNVSHDKAKTELLTYTTRPDGTIRTMPSMIVRLIANVV